LIHQEDLVAVAQPAVAVVAAAEAESSLKPLDYSCDWVG
jgi:hypothetical protein